MKIVALNGMLGYGYAQESLENAFKHQPDFIGVDAGSTDPGPYYLGSGTSFTDRAAVKRDLSLALPEAVRRKIPFIIGTAGGSGASPHVDWLLSIIDELALEYSLTCRYAVIRSDVSPDYVLEKFRQGKISPMGNLELTPAAITSAAHIVAQMSIDPFIKALDAGVDLIIAGRACDTAIYAAPAVRAGYDHGLAFHMAKIMECGSMCSEPLSAADVMLGEICRDSFTLTPMNPSRRCTVERVAAHTLYEQSNPYMIYEPGGAADLRASAYAQVSPSSVRVTGSLFQPAAVKTLKLEGACLAGYRTISIAGIADPETIRRVDQIFSGVKAFAAANLDQINPADYSLTLRKYGGMPDASAQADSGNLGIVIDVVGKTQDMANTICAVARSRMLHFDYPGRKTTAGNLAFPYSPSDIKMGPVYAFGIYHLMAVDDLCEPIRMTYGGYKHGQAD